MSNFSNGEISPQVVARNDLPLYKSIAEWVQNYVVLPQGGVQYRNGTSYVHHTRLHSKAVFIPFVFNDIQAYLIEATDQKFRFYTRNGVITETGVVVTGITASNPGVVTAPTHGFAAGDEVFLNDVNGMAAINGRSYIVAGPTTNTFILNDEFGNAVNTTSFGGYVSGGTAARVYEIDSPYAEIHLEELQYAQKADGMYIVHQQYEPRRLTRAGITNWTLGTYARDADPFTGVGDWPGAVSFTSDSRLVMGGTVNNPETIWGSRTPAPTGDRFDNFDDGGASPTTTHAYRFTLAPLTGKVDTIRWFSNTDKFLVIGTFGSVRRMYGAAQDQPATPTNVNIRAVNAFGAANARPVPNGNELFYIQRDGGMIRSIEYDYTIDSYQSLDKNLVSEHIPYSGIKCITRQAGNPEILWGVRNDGRLVGLTYNDKENKYGWHRHKMGQGAVEWVATLPREQQRDQLWCIVRRVVNGRTVRHVEYMTDPVQFPLRLDFFTDVLSETDDDRRYKNTLYEAQKQSIHLDSSVFYDGSLLTDTTSITPAAGALTENTINVVFTASGNFFNATMVGRNIWKKYDSDGFGGGRARIDEYISATQVRCTILSPFNTLDAILAGDWYLTASRLSGLSHLEGLTVGIIRDGSVQGTQVVQNGQLTLDAQGSTITVGLLYTGLIKTVGLDQGGQSGPALTKVKNTPELFFRILNTGAFKAGTNLYECEPVEFDSTDRVTGRPVPLRTGSERVLNFDSYEREKHIYILQDRALPCTILAIESYTVTTEKG